MPNYVVNKLKIVDSKENIEEIKGFLRSTFKSDEEEYAIPMDFNKITPTPKWIYHGSLGEKEENLYGEENCWYDWNRKNWGTKWNAWKLDDSYYFKYPEIEEKNVIYFGTAWNGVKDLISKLGRIFPETQFEYSWANEDFGYDVGEIHFKGLNIKENIPEGGTKLAYDMACNITNTDLRDHNINDNYEYDESLEED